jgi:hypothetical protein
MNPKHHTSLKIAKQLAEAGIVIESEYVWQKWNNAEDWVIRRPIQRGKRVPEIFQEIPAPIATELLERLPENGKVFDIFGKLFIQKTDGVYRCGYGMYGMEVVDIEASADNLPDTLALLLIRLTKDGLI